MCGRAAEGKCLKMCLSRNPAEPANFLGLAPLPRHRSRRVTGVKSGIRKETAHLRRAAPEHTGGGSVIRNPGN